MKGQTTTERFLDKLTVQDDGCWRWTGATNSTGYGQFYINGRLERAHRVAYEQMVGPIPDGLHIDHLCRNRACVNPDHLEPVTPRENILRGDTLPAANRLKVHCPKGHPYDEANTYVTKRGLRMCRACSRLRDKQRTSKAKRRPTYEVPYGAGAIPRESMSPEFREKVDKAVAKLSAPRPKKPLGGPKVVK